MDIFVDKSVDSNLRGMLVELLVSKSLDNPSKRVSLSTVRTIIKCLSNDARTSEKEFSGFMMNRLYELASEDLYLKKILRYKKKIESKHIQVFIERLRN